MNVKNIFLATAIALTVVACSTTQTTIIPNANGTYTMEASDSTEADALDGGIKAATKACALQQKSLEVLSRQTRYNGGSMDHNTKETINNISMMAQGMNGPQVVQPMSTRNDYTVTIKYRCS